MTARASDSSTRTDRAFAVAVSATNPAIWLFRHRPRFQNAAADALVEVRPLFQSLPPPPSRGKHQPETRHQQR